MEQIVSMEGVVVQLELLQFRDGGFAQCGDAADLVPTQRKDFELKHFHRPYALDGSDSIPVCVREGVLSQISRRLQSGDKSIKMLSLLSAA